MKNYHDGQIILENYKQFNKLSGSLRNKLTHIIITHFLKNNSEKKISTEQLILLSQEISYLFPQENKETYYIPYKSEASIISPARGKLWDKYNNLRKEIRKTITKSTKEISPKDASLPNEGIVNSVQFVINVICINITFMFYP